MTDGSLSIKGWVYNGQLKGVEGKWVFEGTLVTPENHFAFVYRVPREAKGLKLQDGSNALAID